MPMAKPTSIVLTLLALLIASPIGPAPNVAAAELAATQLRCEYLEDPLGIATTQPRLSWIVTSDQRGQKQTAYQVLVASSESLLAQHQGDLWDSGQVSSNQSVHVAYGGRRLLRACSASGKSACGESRRRLHRGASRRCGRWGCLHRQNGRVPSGSGKRSEPRATRRKDINGCGIRRAFPRPSRRPECVSSAASSLCLRDGQVTAAKFHVTCDNGFVLFVNGVQAGQSHDWTQPPALDIREYLTAGENTIAIQATNESSAAGLTGKLTVQFAANESLVIGFDQSWKAADRELAGWTSGSFDDSAWPAAMVLGPMGMAPWGVVRWNDARPTYNLPPSPYLRKVFTAARPIRRATVYASALGCYELHLNGLRVGQDYFNPGWPEFRKRVYYHTYDVTQMMRPGDNAIGAILSDGWYAGYIWAGRDTYGTVPKLRVLLRIEYADGTQEDIVTDETWTLSYGPIREGDVQQGETYDARLEMPGWDTATFDAAAWQPATVAAEINIQMGVSPCPPVRKQEEIRPVRMTEPRPGAYVFDLGQNIAGWVRIKCNGDAGTKIVLRHSGMLNPDGTIYTDYLREARAVDTYMLKGAGDEVWEPSTTYHGFQYVEVTGYPGSPTLDSVQGIVCHSDLPTAGTFECSDARVNKLYSNILWTLRDNLVDIPTGCADRAERLGWCDHNLLFRTECYTIGVAPMIAKWMVDVQDSQSLSANGSFLQCAPIWGDQESPGWSDVGITGVYYLYRFYGDTRIIEEHYDSMARYIEHIRGDLVDYLRPCPYKFADGRTFTGYGDWLSIVFDMKHNEVLNNLFNGRTVNMMAEMAEAVGKTQDAASYRALFENMKAAFNAAYVSADGEIRDKTQAQYALALDYGFLPEDKTQLAVDHLARDVLKNSHQQTFADALGNNPTIPPGHLTTGFHGSRALLPALSKTGATMSPTHCCCRTPILPGSTASRSAQQPSGSAGTPGCRKKGSRTRLMNSFNMPNLGASIGEWLFACVGGIESDGVGFEKILIKPHVGPGLTYARTSYDSIRGTIAVRWEKTGADLVMNVTIPANSTATVSVPSLGTGSVMIQESGTTVWSDGTYVSGVPGISRARLNGDRVELQVGSGSYNFVLQSR